MPDNKPALCFIGFGEAGQAIAAGLRDEGVVRIAADVCEAPGERQRPPVGLLGPAPMLVAADFLFEPGHDE